MVKKPYSEREDDGTSKVRVFESDVKSGELKWHWDEEDRLVELLEPTDWFFQIDNNLPVRFPQSILIERGTWHRVIKGDGRLVVRITKVVNDPT